MISSENEFDYNVVYKVFGQTNDGTKLHLINTYQNIIQHESQCASQNV